MGRPSDFTQEVADAICERLMDGDSLRAICDSDGMPSKVTVLRWLGAKEDFRTQYARAREIQADTMFDDILDIADDGRNDWMEKKDAEGGSIGWRENGEALRRSVLRVDARKWMAAKLQPKKYGEKIVQEHTGPDGGPIQTTDLERARRTAFLLARAAKSVP